MSRLKLSRPKQNHIDEETLNGAVLNAPPLDAAEVPEHELAETQTAPLSERDQKIREAEAIITRQLETGERKAPTIEEALAISAQLEKPISSELANNIVEQNNDTTSGEIEKTNEPEDENEEKFQKYLALAQKEGLTGEEAEARAKQYMFAEQQGLLNRNPQNAAEQQAKQRGGGGGGGGGLGAGIVNAIGYLGKGVGNIAKTAVNYANVKDRIFDHRCKEYENSFHDLKETRETLQKCISKVDEAFFETDGGKRIIDLAAANNVNVNEYLNDIRTGKNTDPDAVIAFKQGNTDEKVIENWKAVEFNAEILGDKSEVAATNLDKLAKNHGDKIDSKEAAGLLETEKDKISSVKPPESGDEQKVKKFLEQMDKIMENLRKVIERLINKITSVFSR